MLVRIVKKDLTPEMEKNAIWATSYMRWAEEEGILEGLTITDSNKAMPRQDAFVMIYNAMYKLGNTGKNSPDFGVKLAVVSKVKAGKIEFNNDPEQTYNFTYDTVLTNGTDTYELGDNSVVPGSLARFIVDADKNITHLQLVSVPVVGPRGAYNYYHYTNDYRIFGLGDKVAGKELGNIRLDSDYRPDVKNITVTGKDEEPVTMKVTKDTKVFAADPSRNALKEFKNIEEALEVFNKDKKDFKGFAIYNEYDSYRKGAYLNEATVLVFTEVDKEHFDSATYRVRYDVNSRYFVGFEKANTGEIVAKNVVGFEYLPGSYATDNLDVVKHREYTRVNDGRRDAMVETIIDYSKANVYRVAEIEPRYIVLETEAKYHQKARVGFPSDVKVFNDGKKLAVGDHVQIANNATAADVKVISVVDKPLKGGLNLGTEEDTRTVRAYVSNVSGEGIYGGYRLVSVYKVDSKGIRYDQEVYYVAEDVYKANGGIDANRYYEFKVLDGEIYAAGRPVAVEWYFVVDTAQDALDRYEKLGTKVAEEAAYKAIMDIQVKDKNDPVERKYYMDEFKRIYAKWNDKPYVKNDNTGIYRVTVKNVEAKPAAGNKFTAVLDKDADLAKLVANDVVVTPEIGRSTVAVTKDATSTAEKATFTIVVTAENEKDKATYSLEVTKSPDTVADAAAKFDKAVADGRPWTYPSPGYSSLLTTEAFEAERKKLDAVTDLYNNLPEGAEKLVDQSLARAMKEKVDEFNIAVREFNADQPVDKAQFAKEFKLK